MKLATLADGTREGRLVVVSHDLTRCSDVRHLAITLRAALDDWDWIAPQLELVARGIEAGGQPVERFHERDAMAPSPCARSLDDGPEEWLAPRASVRLIDAPHVDHAAGAAVILGPTPAGADRASVLASIRLVTLFSGLRRGASWVASMGPVAVAPLALGAAWDGRSLRRALTVSVSGRATTPRADVAADFGELIAQAGADAPLAAGSIVCAHLPKRGAEAPPGALGLAVGDTVRVEMRDANGHSVFGAIEQRLEAAPEALRAALATERR